jgi:AbrB family looped-hinge helix DNA binding protein
MTKSKTDMFPEEKVYGSTVVGARGQVVIPVDARKDLHLNPGDRLIVMGKMGKALGLVKAEELTQIIKTLMEGIDSVDHETAKARFKEHAAKLLKEISGIK